MENDLPKTRPTATSEPAKRDTARAADPANRNPSPPFSAASGAFAAPETSHPPKLQSVTLPKSGGAIKGIYEEFDVSAPTGTGNLALPIPLSHARMTPQLHLSYDTGASNGVFGFGWALNLPGVRRKADKGLPRYDDLGESDVFILSGAEDLVPLLDASVARIALPHQFFGVNYVVSMYRPRIDGLFARIERWHASGSSVSHWRSISKGCVVTLSAKSTGSERTDLHVSRFT